MKRIKEEVVMVKVPNGSPAGVVIEGGANVYQPDKSYSRINGMRVSIGLPDGTIHGGNYVDIGVRDSISGIVLYDSHMEGFQANASVAPDQKYKSVNIPADGRNVYPRVTPAAVATADYYIEFVFRLVDEDVEIGRVHS